MSIYTNYLFLDLLSAVKIRGFVYNFVDYFFLLVIRYFKWFEQKNLLLNFINLEDIFLFFVCLFAFVKSFKFLLQFQFLFQTLLCSNLKKISDTQKYKFNIQKMCLMWRKLVFCKGGRFKTGEIQFIKTKPIQVVTKILTETLNDYNTCQNKLFFYIGNLQGTCLNPSLIRIFLHNFTNNKDI